MIHTTNFTCAYMLNCKGSFGRKPQQLCPIAKSRAVGKAQGFQVHLLACSIRFSFQKLQPTLTLFRRIEHDSRLIVVTCMRQNLAPNHEVNRCNPHSEAEGLHACSKADFLPLAGLGQELACKEHFEGHGAGVKGTNPKGSSVWGPGLGLGSSGPWM